MADAAITKPVRAMGAAYLHLALGLVPKGDPNPSEPHIIGFVNRCAVPWYRVEPYSRLKPSLGDATSSLPQMVGGRLTLILTVSRWWIRLSERSMTAPLTQAGKRSPNGTKNTDGSDVDSGILAWATLHEGPIMLRSAPSISARGGGASKNILDLLDRNAWSHTCRSAGGVVHVWWSCRTRGFWV